MASEGNERDAGCVTVLCFGNSLVEEDAMAKRIAQHVSIPGFTFVGCNSPEEILFYLDRRIVLLDVAINISKARVIEDISMLKEQKIVSLHDFDLAFFLKVLEAMGDDSSSEGVPPRIRIPIIAVPSRGEVESIGRDVVALLTGLFPDDFKEVR